MVPTKVLVQVCVVVRVFAHWHPLQAVALCLVLPGIGSRAICSHDQDKQLEGGLINNKLVVMFLFFNWLKSNQYQFYYSFIL